MLPAPDDRFNPNFHTHLIKFKHKLDNDELLIGDKITGFIQRYTVYPSFTVTLFTENQLQMVSHYDASGSLFAQPQEKDHSTTV